MKFLVFLYSTILFSILLLKSNASILYPTPAAAGENELNKRQNINLTAIGSFSISGLDPSLSSMLYSKASAASSYAAAHSTMSFTSYSSSTGTSSISSSCPQGGQLPNGECCASGIVIAGKCYVGTSSTTTSSAAQTSKTSGSNAAGLPLRLSFTSTALFISTFSAFLLGCIMLLA